MRTPSETPTPRVTSAISQLNACEVQSPGYYILLDLSRALERELAECRTQFAEAKKHLRDANRGAELNSKINRMLARDVVVTHAERDRLRTALERAREEICEWRKECDDNR